MERKENSEQKETFLLTARRNHIFWVCAISINFCIFGSFYEYLAVKRRHQQVHPKKISDFFLPKNMYTRIISMIQCVVGSLAWVLAQ